MKTTPAENKALVLRAFDTLFNRRDFEKAATYWSESYVQHSALVPGGREGLFNLVRSLKGDRHYENHLAMAEGDFVMLHGRFSGGGDPRGLVACDILRIEDGRLAEHWDVLQQEASRAESKGGHPMFGDAFPE